ncbi:MAG: amidohydrolase family protein [Flavobacteriaceae bacterium]
MGERICIRGGRVLDLEGEAAPHRDILIEDGAILALLAPEEAEGVSARTVDASDCLLMPGMVNAHTHGHGSLGRGKGDRWTLDLLLNAGPWLSGMRTQEHKYLSAALNAAEMILKGCTAAYDLYFEFPAPTPEGMDAVARAYRDVGVRTVIAPMLADLSLYEAIPGLMDSLPEPMQKEAGKFRLNPFEETAKACEVFLKTWSHPHEEAKPALAPTIPLHCSDPFLERCRDLAEEYGVAMHMHLAESKTQAVSAAARYGRTLTAHLDALGLLGPRFTAAHGIWLDDDDIARMADRGCSVAHNPGSNLRLGTGVAPVRKLLDAGVCVGVGSDGSNSSDNQNMFEATRLAANVSRLCDLDVNRWVSAREALEMATVNGARMLDLPASIGRIAPGARADIVFLDLNNVNLVPFNDPLNLIVYSEDATSVKSVMVDGRLVLEDRRFVSFDYAGLRRKAEEAALWLRERTEETRKTVMGLESFVARHCLCLCREKYHVKRLVCD